MRSATSITTWLVVACLVATLPAGSMAQQAPPSPGDEAHQIEILKSDAPLFDKAKACQMLAVIGTADSVPVLAALLPNPELSHYARFGLEPNPDPAVDAALRASLDQLEGGLLVGVINSIGMRRDQAAVGALKDLTGSSDQETAAAAMAALGRIATPEAIETLKAAITGPLALRAAAADACLTACDMLLAEGKNAEAIALYDTLREANLPERLTIAALHGAIRARGAKEGLPMLAALLADEDKAKFAVALRMAHELGGPDVAKTLIDAMEKLPTQRRILVIYVLGDLGEPAALPVVLKLAESETTDVRLPAVQVLALLGNASAVPVLLDAASANDETLAGAALESLANLSGKDVDAKLAEALQGSSGAQQLLLIQLAGLRGIESAVPALLKLADADDPAIRSAAIAALGLTINLKQLPALVDRLVAPKSSDVAATTREALVKALQRMPDRNAAAGELTRRMSAASTSAKVDLLGLLGVVGGDQALQAVASAAKDGSDEVQDAATRALGEWMSPDAAPVLLELAKTGSDKYKVRTLRGYIRIARQLDVPTDERIEMCRKTIAAAQRDDEKKLALEVLGRYPTAEGLKLAETLLDTYPAAVAEAMATAAKNASDRELVQQARNLQRRAARKAAGN
ncbi:MAG: HEAT repeat domain-containing protein [Planctomycetes bacterium]|nr:HEAT repeat domain-containing protein [Planctomycetota bacterium]